MAFALETLGRDHLLEQEALCRKLATETPEPGLRETLLGMADIYANAAETAGDVSTIDPVVVNRRRRHEAALAH